MPRPPAVAEMLFAQERDELSDLEPLYAAVGAAVIDTVQRQARAGIDVVSDGEMGKYSYATYIRHRLSGFGPADVPRAVPADVDEFPALRDRLAASGSAPSYLRPTCSGPIAYEHLEPLERDLQHLRAAVDQVGSAEAFMTAPSPGVLALFQPNDYYPSDRAYLEALGGAMRYEYQAIVAAGFLLQVDCPDLALGRHTKYRTASDAEFVKGAEERIGVLNDALAGLPSDSVRAHVCWGNYEGPHHLDIPLKKIQRLLLTINANALLIEGANPRHVHEWELWEEHRLPDDKILVPGVIDTTTNYIEHPEAIAQRICQLAKLVGREQVIAGTDCGFGSVAGFSSVDPDIAYAKLGALAQGAAIASTRLW